MKYFLSIDLFIVAWLVNSSLVTLLVKNVLKLKNNLVTKRLQILLDNRVSLFICDLVTTATNFSKIRYLKKAK